MNNHLHNLESLKGKIIVLNFWFTECKPCVSEIPNLNKLKQKFNPENVAFFAVTFDDKETINNFILKHQLDYTIIPNGRKITNQFKIPYYPFNIIIDQNGKIEYINNSFSFNILKKVETKIKNKLK
jgi:peroxiredoxin